MSNEFENSVTVREVTWSSSSKILSNIRFKVFVEEQQVPPTLELDGLDETAVHILAESPEGTPVGTARLLLNGQIGRMAVLKNYRRKGIGRLLLRSAISIAQSRKYKEVFLHAQLHAMSFYEENGFIARGENFEDAGITHREMFLPNSS